MAETVCAEHVLELAERVNGDVTSVPLAGFATVTVASADIANPASINKRVVSFVAVVI